MTAASARGLLDRDQQWCQGENKMLCVVSYDRNENICCSIIVRGLTSTHTN